MECFRCGVCCTKYQPLLTLVEAQRITDYLGLSLKLFLEKFTDNRWCGKESLLNQVNGACVFLCSDANAKLNTCRIQPVKPQACLDWEPGLYPPECRAGLGKHWHLSVNSAGQLEGNKGKIDEFRSFLESLAAGKTEPNP